MCSNIPGSPLFGVYISQFIRFARASSNYSDLLKRQKQWYNAFIVVLHLEVTMRPSTITLTDALHIYIHIPHAPVPSQ
jgi:hypothetical protein